MTHERFTTYFQWGPNGMVALLHQTIRDKNNSGSNIQASLAVPSIKIWNRKRMMPN